MTASRLLLCCLVGAAHSIGLANLQRDAFVPPTSGPTRSCSSRPVSPAYGVFHVDPEQWSKCTQDERNFGGCGDRYRANLTACTSSSGDGTVAQEFLMGPFTSTGGYDWWLIQYLPFGNVIVSDMGDAAFGGYGLTIHAGAPPTTADAQPGVILGLPPLHYHHASIRGNCDALFDIAGDIQCTDAIRGVECLSVDLLSGGFVARLNDTCFDGDDTLLVDAIFNDVRPTNSEPLTWYFNFSITTVTQDVVAARRLDPIGRMFLSHAATASSDFNTFLAPKERDSFTVRQGTWPADGALITEGLMATRFHSHDVNFHRSFLIRGSAAELGWDTAPFYSSTGCDAVDTTDAGFANNQAVLDALASRCPECFSRGQGTRLICAANVSLAYVGDEAYDRRAHMSCTSERPEVHKGEAYTAVGFYGHQPENLNPLLTQADENGLATSHDYWFFAYVTAGGGPPGWHKQNPQFLTEGDLDLDKCRIPRDV